MRNRKLKRSIKNSAMSSFGAPEIIVMYKSLLCYRQSLLSYHSSLFNETGCYDDNIQTELNEVESCIGFFEACVPELARVPEMGSPVSFPVNESEV